jgi:TRAP-type C4-dicarboxylate transport system permease small subunit
MSESHPKRWHIVAFAVLGVACAMVLCLMLAGAYEKVATGHGADTYRTVWLVEFSYIGLLVFAGAAVVALVVAAIFGALHRARERRSWRELDDKYGPNARRDVRDV